MKRQFEDAEVRLNGQTLPVKCVTVTLGGEDDFERFVELVSQDMREARTLEFDRYIDMFPAIEQEIIAFFAGLTIGIEVAKRGFV
jgi:hypothetical protein